MLHFLPPLLKALITTVLMSFNLTLCGSSIALLGLLKITPVHWLQNRCTSLSLVIYRWFIIANKQIIQLTSNPEWHVEFSQPIEPESWNLIISNHKSWLDILVIMQLFGEQLPPPKFFLKKELIWLPFVGIASWALDMPFICRYSHSFLKKNPHLKGKDIETTRRSCEKFKSTPTTIVNFVEGTRYTTAKHQRQKSPFQHLLKPKAGGIAFTLAAMGEQFENIIDVTLEYPGVGDDDPAFLKVLSGQLKKVQVHVHVEPLNQSLIGDYFTDKGFRVDFQRQLNERWQLKDDTLESWQKESAHNSEHAVSAGFL